MRLQCPPVILFRALAPCIAAVMALMLALFFGCAPSGAVKQGSPRLMSAQIAAAGDGTEAGQRVELRLQFSAELAEGALDAALGDLVITLNGKELDREALAVALGLEGGNATALLLTITPAEGAGGPASAHYFALYDGALKVSARADDGALPHLLSAKDPSACAQLPEAIEAQVPSGLRIETQGGSKGSPADGTRASCTFRVTNAPNIRVMAFVELSPGGERIKLHNHEFSNYSEDAPDGFTALLAQEAVTLLGEEYLVEQSGDTIVITHDRPVEGEVLAPRVIEGVKGDG
ncbi:MAG: hypothetical protein LBG81_07950 [Coriobacteriaceae bacterium]|nr:hypothetical protein [Coriobacteriaceae bacterium]